MEKMPILDISVSSGCFADFIENIISLAIEEVSSYVCVCNVHMLIESKKDRQFQQILNNANIVTPDGMPVAKALGYKYNYCQDRVSGMDLMPILIEECSKRNKSIYLYGSTKKVLNYISEKVNLEFPQLRITYKSPPFRALTLKEEVEIIDDINTFNPDFVFVALGCPKQEKWMAKHKGKINSCMIGLGGAFSVYSGLQKRAPKWMRYNSLEWFHRLLIEPRRLFARYFVTNSLFFYYFFKDIIKDYNSGKI